MNIQNAAALMIVLSASVVMLILGQQLIIPFIFALLIWLLVRRIKSKMNRLPFIRSWFPTWLTTIVMSAIIISFFAFIAQLLTYNIESLANSFSNYESNITHVTQDINHFFGIDSIKILHEYSGSLNLAKAFTSLFSSLSGMLGNTIVIILYTAFIFLEETNFQTKLKGIFPKKNQFDQVTAIAAKIENSVANYIGLKTLVNLISATISFIILLIVGIDSAIFWAFLIFLVNFIPVIGLFVGTIFPAVFALIQFGEFTPALILFFTIGSVQFAVGNVLEPRIMGNSLNISPLVAIIALAFWGTLWGITGMFLSVPITVIMIIIFSHFPKTKPIAILFSEKGKI